MIQEFDSKYVPEKCTELCLLNTVKDFTTQLKTNLMMWLHSSSPILPTSIRPVYL